ncbi:MAG: alpha/beta hydrolase family protein [Rubrivivax sp.]
MFEFLQPARGPAGVAARLARLARWRGAARVLAALALGAAAGLPPAQAQTAAAGLGNTMSAADYVRKPSFTDVSLSPSGKRLAMIIQLPSGRKAAAVLNLPISGPPRAVLNFDDADVTDVDWINDDRLRVKAVEIDATAVVDEFGVGEFAVNHDGSNPRQLIVWTRAIGGNTGSHMRIRVLPFGWFVWGFPRDGSPDLIVTQRVLEGGRDAAHHKVGRLDTSNGVLTLVGMDLLPGTSHWVADAQGEPRAAVVNHKGREKLVLRKPGGGWEVLEDVAWPQNSVPAPALLETEDQLLVWAYRGQDTQGLYTYDLKARKLLPEPVVVLKGYDLSRVVAEPKTQRLLGVRATTDRPWNAWFDPKLAQIQRAVDGALPGRHNLLSCGYCSSSPFVLVSSASDRLPTEYFLYDVDKRSLQRVGGSRPWVQEAQQGRRTWHRVAARDGLELPVVVTHPAGSTEQQALPTVVLVHGGPWVRGSSLAWDEEAQFLASRGYRVLQPEFRGSDGFGARLWRAGIKQWGLAMQDDLQDVAQWAVKQGLSDGTRQCLVGASYGGYAALMGPVRHPGQWRCVASFAGVTDIDLMYTAHSDFTVNWRSYGMPDMVGDRVKDAEQLKATSPLQRVAEIKVPVLMGYGWEDRRVPRAHAEKFISAAKDAKVDIEVVSYPHEGHGFGDEKNQADYYNRLAAFLARHLKP